MTMKAARWYAQKDIRVESISVPTPKANQVKIAIKYAGICGSDLHEYLAGPIFVPTAQEHIYTGQKAPITLGHEFAGEVVEVGAEVLDVQVGDRVTVEPIIAKNGLVGNYNLDPNVGFVGLMSDGGFAEFCVVDADLIHKLPENIDYEQGALVEPAAVALHAVRRSKLKSGDNAAVFGCGPIGLLIIEALRSAGATNIYAVELSKERQDKARELGAIIIDPSKVNAAEEIQRLTNGGVEVAFEVTGVSSVLQQVIDSANYSGDCIIVSIWEGEATFHPNSVVFKEKTIKGSLAYRDIFPSVLQLMQKGFFSKDKLVTKRIKLDDIVNEGFEALVKEKNHIKILVEPK